MQCCPFDRSGNVVGHLDLDGISPIGPNGRTRELAVNEHYGFIDPVRSNPAAADCEIIGPNNASVL